jgi:plasmid stabilization system protein ParE
MAKIVVHPAAEKELLDSYLYYARLSLDLASRFDEQVNEALQKIAQHPTRGTAYDARHRFFSLKNYPHVVIYRYDDVVATVIAIHHPSRDTAYWQDR